MNKQTISIIIPAYNEERYLGRCLDSIAALTVQPHEVIVVDNNSADKTARIAQKYRFVRVLHEPRQGRVYAQQTGFDAATGTTLARIDADAVLPADWTARIAEHFDRPGAFKTAWTGGAAFYNVRLPRATAFVYGLIGFRLNRLLIGHPSLWGSSMALPKAQWEQVAGQMCQRADLHEDLDLSVHLHRQGCAIVYDRYARVQAELRPAFVGVHQLWAYLQMWPRTLQVHGIWTWVFCWPVNVGLFVAGSLFGVLECIARLFGRKPLNP